MVRATKIVATLGPASSSPEVLERMLRAGVDVVRLNFSHGKAQDHIDRATLVREVAALGGDVTAGRWDSTLLRIESRAADGHQDAWVQMRLGSETLWTLGIGSGLAPDGTDEWAVGCSFDDADGVAVLFGSYHPGLGSTDAYLSLVNAQGSTIQKILLVEPLHDGTHEPRALARDGDGALVMVVEVPRAPVGVPPPLTFVCREARRPWLALPPSCSSSSGAPVSSAPSSACPTLNR